MRNDGDRSLASIRLQNAGNSAADAAQLLVKAQNVMDEDLTGLIAEAQEVERKIGVLRARLALNQGA